MVYEKHYLNVFLSAFSDESMSLKVTHVDTDDEVLKGQGKKNTQLHKCIILIELIKMGKKVLFLSNILCG